MGRGAYNMSAGRRLLNHPVAQVVVQRVRMRWSRPIVLCSVAVVAF